MLNQLPRIDIDAISKHYSELSRMSSKKHVMYNSLLKLFRKKGIPVQTVNNRIIICRGLLNGLWFRPSGLRCSVSLSAWNVKHRKGVGSFNFVVDCQNKILFDKLLKHEIISVGVHEFLTTSNKD